MSLFILIILVAGLAILTMYNWISTRHRARRNEWERMNIEVQDILRRLKGKY